MWLCERKSILLVKSTCASSFDYSLAKVLALVMPVWEFRILDFPGIMVFPMDLFFLAVILKLFSRSNPLREKKI